MNRDIATGIDIGTHEVKVVVARRENRNESPKIIGVGRAASSGLRHGYIINSPLVSKSIKEAVREAEKMSGVEIKSAHLSIGGISLDSMYTNGQVMISRSDRVITELDMEKAIEEARRGLPSSYTLNRREIHSIPVYYKIDEGEVLGSPEGMKGSRLEVRVMFVTCLEGHLNDLVGAVEDSGIEVIDLMASPIAGALSTLTKTQKVAGCVLANIGAETVSIVVYENDIPISVKVFPIGSQDITHDIALGLQIDIEEAEKVKIGGNISTNISKKKLEDIVEARLTDIFELVEKHLKKLGKNELLPAGIIITGGGSGVTTIEDVAKALLKIPSRRAEMEPSRVPQRTGVKDSTWAVAYGMTIFALKPDEVLTERGISVIKRAKDRAVSLIKKFLP